MEERCFRASKDHRFSIDMRQHKSKRLMIVIVGLTLCCLKIMAQTVQVADSDSIYTRQITVIDNETKLPISGVTVRLDGNVIQPTDYLGRTAIRERFSKIAFSHQNYDTEELSFYELTDTMELFPRHNVLDEVVVTGVGPDLRRAMKAAHERNLQQKAVQGLSFDFGLLLDKRARRDRKHLKKAREILTDWDMQPVYKEK